jgi:predicted ATP-grasp superfamily ATP-dependent carboligase
MNSVDVRFTNFEYDKHTLYFIFISEIKAYGLGHFFKEAIAKVWGVSKDKVEFITIAPDVFEQYNYDNLIILNEVKDKQNSRKPHHEFISQISKNPYVHSMIDTILENQDELFIYMFESSPHMTLDQRDGVTLIGPNSDIVKTLSNKIALYEIFSDIVPMANYSVSHGFDELMISAQKLMQRSGHPLFISLETSAAGANSIIANSLEDIETKFKDNKDDTFLVTEFISHISDPTTLGVVINEDEIYVAGVADQRIDGTRFKGSTFPSKNSNEIQEELIRQTRVVGKKMAKLGYRGIFGCDYIVTKNNEVFFIETNPRKQGTTMEFCCALKTALPMGAPNLPEIEFYAVTESRRPPRMREPDFFKTDIYWGTYNYKIEAKLRTHRYLPQQRGEIEMFQSVAKNKINKEFMILEHIGQDFFVNEGSFLGRVIATGKSHKDVEDGIEMGKHMMDYTVKSYVDTDFTLEERCYSCPYYVQKL